MFKLRRLIAIFFLSLMGCSNGYLATDSNMVQSTPTPTQEQVILPELFNPTDLISSPDEQEQKIVFEPRTFTHSENIFSMDISEDWQVDAELYSATITDPQNTLTINVSLVNTGYVLSLDSFKNFIDIQEEKAATVFSEYIQIDMQEVTNGNSYLVTNLVSLGGQEKILATSYQQHEALILKINFLTDKDLFDANEDTVIKVINSANVNTDIALDDENYSFDVTDRYSNGYFSNLVPPFWRNDEVQDEYTILNTFSSPDGQAIIQMLVFDDGNRMSNNIAAGFALKLLRDNYAKDIVILKDEVMHDGREKLQWRSVNDNYHGETAFATCGSALFMMTVMSYQDLDPIYHPLLEDFITSYSVEVACD